MRGISRRTFLGSSAAGVLAALAHAQTARAAEAPPNVILCMTDDQGWADTGYNGHPVLKTPHLDAMAGDGIRFDRFYSGAPVCSPTRGSCLTGRHPSRYGIDYANDGHMREGEVTLAEVLKARGYTTGHFGKWHLGTLTKAVEDSNRGGPQGVAHYAPPWEHGFDVCFSTEAKVPTWDPMRDPDTGKPYNTRYWTGPGQVASDNLEGDDSRIIMDRVLPFIRRAAGSDTPFFAVVWFHAPHKPVVSGPPFTEMYEEHTDYFGCITAMDAQIGRLRAELAELGVADTTMLWFTSDNGPENGTPGSAGPLRGRKRDLYEGGIRVPGLVVWPAHAEPGRRVAMPCSTSDYFPTVLDALGLWPGGVPDRPWDGVSLLPLLNGAMEERPKPIAFASRKKLALIDGRYKLYSDDLGKTFALYDLEADVGEQRDLAPAQPERVAAMRKTLDAWRESCRDSRHGDDYEGGTS